MFVTVGTIKCDASFDGEIQIRQVLREWVMGLPKKENIDGLDKLVMWLKKVSVGYVSRSCDFPKKEIS